MLYLASPCLDFNISGSMFTGLFYFYFLAVFHLYCSVWASPVVALGLSSWGHAGSVVVRSWFPHQGLNLCPLHWKADSSTTSLTMIWKSFIMLFCNQLLVLSFHQPLSSVVISTMSVLIMVVFSSSSTVPSMLKGGKTSEHFTHGHRNNFWKLNLDK